MEPCSIGIHLGQTEDCHKTVYSRRTGLKNISELTPDAQQLLLRRCNFTAADASTNVCCHHEKIFIDKYSFLQKMCCDPFSLHPESARKKSLRVIDLTIADKIKTITGNVVHPGQKLCPNCRKCFEEPTSSEPESEDTMEYADLEAGPSTENIRTLCSISDTSVTALDTTLTEAGFTPVKPKKVSQRDVIGYGKRKAEEVKAAAVSQLAMCLQVPKDVLVNSSVDCVNCTDLKALIDGLKNKLSVTDSTHKKLMILTLAPQSWSIDRSAEEFGVSTYLVKKARSLKKMHGILPDVSLAKKGKELSQTTVDKVIALYESDEFSRMCPGQKEYVSVKIDGKRIQKQKRLLLVNLKEMFENFRQKEVHEKIGFSKFCELRPRWCVTVGSRGSHSVCICEIHQNVKLMITALHKLGVNDYEELMRKLVCDTKSRNCMMHRCDKCPGIESFSNYLLSLFTQAEMNDDDQIPFKQWDHSERGCNLVTRSESVVNFIEELSRQMENLTVHHYISKAQSAYLSFCKTALSEDTALILLDFAENYSFIVQDAIQGHHWNNSQATLHPFAVYYLNEGVVQCMSICVISDCMQHDSITVHVFIKVVLDFLKDSLPKIKRVKYFSDGAASQYKNFKNFQNLLFHYDDFGLAAEWHFFATSHGKSPCDGIGGTVKRLAARASLQAVNTNHILSPKDLFEWASSHIPGIKFFFVSKDEVDMQTKEQEARFSTAKKIPGTRNHHCFIPVNNRCLKLFRISSDTEGTLVDEMSASTATPELTQLYIPGKYIAAVYDQAWYVGNIVERDDEKDDVLVNFMTRTGDSSFQWPQKKDECWVPLEHILCILPVPSTSSSGRQYHLPDQVLRETEELFHKFSCQHF